MIAQREIRWEVYEEADCTHVMESNSAAQFYSFNRRWLIQSRPDYIGLT
jgi:hypothetical protein